MLAVQFASLTLQLLLTLHCWAAPWMGTTVWAQCAWDSGQMEHISICSASQKSFRASAGSSHLLPASTLCCWAISVTLASLPVGSELPWRKVWLHLGQEMSVSNPPHNTERYRLGSSCAYSLKSQDPWKTPGRWSRSLYPGDFLQGPFVAMALRGEQNRVSFGFWTKNKAPKGLSISAHISSCFCCPRRNPWAKLQPLEALQKMVNSV